ncbi:sigma 54-interacting transcriptional regulator [Brevibacillus sp. B_LB10_24]|uniref:sigma 54-interacting transcriptional regulator n=1 Tax=Brevibacillus sp. B_LB10_24 TaxID=3380645 RepID=UPI0038BCD55F
MLEQVKGLIEREDRKNALTDEQISELLGIRREEVTSIRSQLRIPDSRKRRKPVLLQAMRNLLVNDEAWTSRKLTRKLTELGFNVSRYTVTQFLKELEAESPFTFDQDRASAEVSGLPAGLSQLSTLGAGVGHTRVEQRFGKAPDRTESQGAEASANRAENWLNKPVKLAFDEIIGSRGSLRRHIQQAKAAVLYPPHGLHTLILGATGVGKSQMAEAMYYFALDSERIPPHASFVVFNCADYAENPQLLMAQLFGSVKGAYTGADRDRPGLIEKANGGILFLDEVHRLPPEGQELLFTIIDKGRFRRLGETDTQRTAHLMIIAATSESAESSLLITFRRRIPMIIELPTINERPVAERHEVILQFFLKEANRTGARIKVHAEVIRSLLLYDCPGNIGQLRSDIQVACARAFLRYVAEQRELMEVVAADLPEHAKRGLLHRSHRRMELQQLVPRDVLLSPNQADYYSPLYETLYSLPAEIYQHIEQRYFELQQQGGTKETINRILGEELESRFQQMMRRLELHTKPMAGEELVKIVGASVVETVEKMIWIAEQRLQKNFDRLYYALAIHIHTSLERLQQGKTVFNPHLERVKENHPLEYKVAAEMVSVVNHHFEVELSENEIGFIAMYLCSTSSTQADDSKVGVVIVSHGSVAQGMADVANRLLGVQHARAVEMSLDESPKAAFERTLETVKEANEGKGVVLLVDMGSLVTFGDLITERTGIPTRTIHRTNTVLVVESVRKAMLPDITLDELVDSLDPDTVFAAVHVPGQVRQARQARAILTVCITGQRSAVKLKEMLEERMPELLEQVSILPVSAIVENGCDKLEQYRATYDVIATVGTIDPGLLGVPFISLGDITSGRGADFLRRLLKWSQAAESTEAAQPLWSKERLPEPQPDGQELEPIPTLSDLLHEQLVFFGSSFGTKEELLDFLHTQLKQRGYVTDDYYPLMVEREKVASPVFEPQTAIPHADPTCVVHAGIAAAILDEPVEWFDGQKVRYVFMLALKENCQRAVQELYEIMQREDVRELLDMGLPPEQVIRILGGGEGPFSLGD